MMPAMSLTATQTTQRPTVAKARSLPDDDVSRDSATLAFGLALLRCFTPDQPVLGVAELSDLLGVGRRTTHRYACMLVELGFLEQRRSRKYRLGREAYSLGLAAIRSNGLSELARPWLVWLRSMTGFTASLAFLDGEEAVYGAWLPSSFSGQAEPAMAHRAGWSTAAHSSAAGLALLAFTGEEDWPSAIQSRMHRTSGGHRLRNELRDVCERRYAISSASGKDRRAGIAAPVLGALSPVAAVELTVFGSAADVELRGFAGYVARTAQGIADQLEEESQAAA